MSLQQKQTHFLIPNLHKIITLTPNTEFSCRKIKMPKNQLTLHDFRYCATSQKLKCGQQGVLIRNVVFLYPTNATDRGSKWKKIDKPPSKPIKSIDHNDVSGNLHKLRKGLNIESWNFLRWAQFNVAVKVGSAIFPWRSDNAVAFSFWLWRVHNASIVNYTPHNDVCRSTPITGALAIWLRWLLIKHTLLSNYS